MSKVGEDGHDCQVGAILQVSDINVNIHNTHFPLLIEDRNDYNIQILFKKSLYSNKAF